ncbi:MAG: hypothetical protein H0W11_02295 [Gemmatimonadetes bacterium]|nr:hypothetical protein [Gemmatimonadota bacterium]
MIATLTAAGFRVGRDLAAFICADGTHSEWFWRREFPAAYRWLFAGTQGTGERVRKQRPAAAACTPQRGA